MRRLQLPLLSLLTVALLGPPTGSRACDAETLAGLELTFGAVLSRQPLPAIVERTVETEVQRIEAQCELEETDEACIARLTAAHASILTDGQHLTVTLDGPRDRVSGVFEVAGERREQIFDSYEAMAAHLEALREETEDVQLVRAQQIIDPAHRTAWVLAVVDTVETVDIGAGSRMDVRLSMSPLDALHASRDLADISVVEWSNEPDGTAILVLRCRD